MQTVHRYCAPIFISLLLLLGCAPSSTNGILPADLERFELIPEADADCSAFDATHGESWEGESMYFDSLEDLYEASELVAMGVIEAILPPRYWTETGALSEDDEDGTAIFRPVVLRLDEVLKGDAALTGLVLNRMGGCDRRIDFEFESSPELITGEVGDRVLIFAELIPDYSDDPPPWFIHFEHAATIRAKSGRRYEQALTLAWIRDVDGMAEAWALPEDAPEEFDEVVGLLR